LNRLLFSFCLLALTGHAHAGMCPSPPVVTLNQATCLARDFVESPSPPPWQTDYRIFKTTRGWSVRFAPRTPTPRGGSGELFIDAQSGRVSVIRMDR